MNVNKFKTIVAEFLSIEDLDEVNLSWSIYDDLLLSDVGFEEMLGVFEFEFDVDIINADEDFETLNDIVKYIKSEM